MAVLGADVGIDDVSARLHTDNVARTGRAMSGSSPGAERQSPHMSEHGICGKPTIAGPPCQNPSGCRVKHQLSSPGSPDGAQRKAVEAATAAALHEHVDETNAGFDRVAIRDPHLSRSALRAPVEVWNEWCDSDKSLWGRSPDYDPSGPAFEIIDRSDDVIRRLGAERADFLEARGLSWEAAQAAADRWAEASIDLRDAAFGLRPTSTATITLDYGHWPRPDGNPDNLGPRDPRGANCEMKSEDGRTTLDIEGLHEGQVLLNLRHDPEHLGWGHTEPEVGWYLTEDEARTLVAELRHRFGWDEH